MIYFTFNFYSASVTKTSNIWIWNFPKIIFLLFLQYTSDDCESIIKKNTNRAAEVSKFLFKYDNYPCKNITLIIFFEFNIEGFNLREIPGAWSCWSRNRSSCTSWSSEILHILSNIHCWVLSTSLAGGQIKSNQIKSNRIQISLCK